MFFKKVIQVIPYSLHSAVRGQTGYLHWVCELHKPAVFGEVRGVSIKSFTEGVKDWKATEFIT